MIFTILLWMGMQGQATCPDSCWCVYNVKTGRTIERHCKAQWEESEPHTPLLLEPNVFRDTWLNSERRYSDDRNSSDAAAEHVYEIRTHKREVEYWLPAANPTDGDYIIGFAGQCIRDGDKWSAEKRACGIRRRTHELWLDGKRLGTLKYSDK